MSKDSSIAYEIGNIKPGEKKELQIVILIDENKNISDIEDEIERVKRIDFEKEYWWINFWNFKEAKIYFLKNE